MRKKRPYWLLAGLIPALFIIFSVSNLDGVNSPNAKEINSDQAVDTSLDLSEHFITLLIGDRVDESKEALSIIEKNWHIGLMPYVLEVMSFARPSEEIDGLIDLMRKTAGKQSEELSVNEW